MYYLLKWLSLIQKLLELELNFFGSFNIGNLKLSGSKINIFKNIKINVLKMISLF